MKVIDKLWEAVARGWCHTDTRAKTVDPVLAKAIVQELGPAVKKLLAAERLACARIARKYEPDERSPCVTYASDEILARCGDGASTGLEGKL